MVTMRRAAAVRIVAAVLVGGALAQPALAAPCKNDVGFDRWLEDFKREAVAQGVSRQVADSALAGVAFDPGIVNRDRGQGVFQQSFLQFAGRMADGYRIGTGRAKPQQPAPPLARPRPPVRLP